MNGWMASFEAINGCINERVDRYRRGYIQGYRVLADYWRGKVSIQSIMTMALIG